MKEFDWNLIKSFVAVAETGSLSGAARRLAASQPTLGRHIAELAAALGVTLFRRGRRGYELTEAGGTPDKIVFTHAGVESWQIPG